MWRPFKRGPVFALEIAETKPRLWRFSAALRSDTGCVRTLNEDAGRLLHASAPKALLAIVADGMGGHQAGEVASRLAVDLVCRAYNDGKGTPGERLRNALLLANQGVYDLASSEERLTGMGTTCTALALWDGGASMAHVGDSRLYLIRDNEMYQMTEDHSLVMELVRCGAITAEQAREHPDRNVLHRALGRHAAVEVSCWPQAARLEEGDRYLLCSDGLSGVLPDETIRQVAIAGDPETACAALISLARRSGAPDNVTVGIVAVHKAEEDTGDLPPTRELDIPGFVQDQ